MPSEHENLRRYFLGQLSEADADHVDLRIIEDPDFESEMLAAEQELIEDYRDGELSDEERRLFEENYLITPERRKNLVAYSVLSEVSADRGRKSAASSPGTISTGSFFDRLQNLIPIPVFAAAVAVVVLVGGYLLVVRNSSSSAVQTEFAALNRGDLSQLNELADLPVVTVFPGSTRGGPAAKVTSKGGGRMLVRVALPPEFADASSLNAKVSTGRTEILSLDGVRVYSSEKGRELRLLLPSAVLPAGSCDISVSRPERPDAPISYTFTVE